MQPLSLRCHHSDCNRPWAQIYNGVLSVESMHRGIRHTNAVSLELLMKMLKGSHTASTDAELIRLLEALQIPIVDRKEIQP